MSTYSPEQFAEVMAKFPSVFLSKFDAGMRRYLRAFASGTMARRISGRPGLFNRTGALRRSFNFVVQNETSLDGWNATVYTTSPYARAHEEGATILPRKGKFLTIPMGPARTAAGVTRGGARSFANTFFLRTKAGKLLLAMRQGKKFQPLFLLVASVRIPARLGFKSSWDAEADTRKAVFARAIKDTLDGPKAA